MPRAALEQRERTLEAFQGSGQISAVVSVELAGLTHLGQQLKPVSKLLARCFRGRRTRGVATTVHRTAPLGAVPPIHNDAPLYRHAGKSLPAAGQPAVDAPPTVGQQSTSRSGGTVNGGVKHDLIWPVPGVPAN